MFLRRRRPGDFNAEIEAHLALEADRLREDDAALSKDEARLAARRAFGNVTRAQERFFERSRWMWWDDLRRDVRFGLRTLRATPGFTVVAMVTLALGIGVNATIFSWIDSTLLNPIPGATGTDRIVSIARGGTAEAAGEFSYPDYADLRDRSHRVARLIAFNTRPMDLTGSGRPMRVWGTATSANYFEVLGVRPMLGRGFLPSDGVKPGAAPVVVLSYALWQARFGGDSRVIGRIIDIDRHPFTVIGVAPAAFQGSQTGLRTDLWVPLMMEQEVISDADRLDDRGSDWLMVQGRLAPGVSPVQARQELNVLMQHLVAQYPDDHVGDHEVGVYRLWQAPGGANAYFSTLLPMLMALAGLVLLLACANVANLLLVRSMARRREIAIRLSMGAGRGRVVRQLLVESMLLALAGGGLAMTIAEWTAGTFRAFIPATGLPVALHLRPDRTVLLATLAAALVTGVIFGLVPALRSSAIAPAAVLKEETGSLAGGRRQSRLTGVLVVAQLALSILLLAAAGLFIRGLHNAERIDPGFNPDHVLVASYDLYAAGYNRTTGLAFDRDVLAKLGGLPGVVSATLADAVPLGFERTTEMVRIGGYTPRPHEDMEVRSDSVGPDYLGTLQIPLVEGRDFTVHDSDASRRVAIVNEAFARRYWPNQEALGRRVWAEDHWSTVVGVARDSDYDRLDQPPEPFLYLPMLQDYWTSAVLEVRVTGKPMAAAAAVEKTVHALNPGMPLYGVAPLASFTQAASARQRIAGAFVGAFGLLALLLATVGLYGIVAYRTGQRRHEIGVRMALGADRADVLWLVLRQGMRLALIGLVAGLGLALPAMRLLRGELFGVSPDDAFTFVSAAALLSVVALVACCVPAWRATRVNAFAELRHE